MFLPRRESDKAAARISQAKVLIQLAIGERSGVRSYLAAMEFERQARVKIDPQRRRS